MRKAICLMVIGDKYTKIFRKVEKQFYKYSEKCNAELKIISEPLDMGFHRPILAQKLLIADKFKNYDEVAFMDLDILISKNAPSIFDFLPEDKDFAAVLDPRGTEEFNETWKHIPRILAESTQKYFSDRNFQANKNLKGSINGGVFLLRPHQVAHLFSEYYFSNHNQGELNAFEEAPMAYITQTREIFAELPIEFNTQVLYKIKGTTEGKEVIKKYERIPKFIRNFYEKKFEKTIFPTSEYRKFIENRLDECYFLHFAGGFPMIKI